MAIAEDLKAAYLSARDYPELAGKLIFAGVLSYTVEVPTGITLYRLANGAIHLNSSTAEPREIAAQFDEGVTIQAIRDNQQKKTDYAGFMADIAKAGVRFYEATLNGNNKRVTYIGTGGFYEEPITI